MDTVLNFVVPNCWTPYQISAIAFANQQIAFLQLKAFKFVVVHFNRLDFLQVEFTTLNIRNS